VRWANLFVLVFSAASVLADTSVTLTGATVGAEVCRFQARDREKPIERWLSAQTVTCVASDAALTFPPGLWNVFARARGAVSVDPIVINGTAAPVNGAASRVNGPAAPAHLDIALVPAATLVLQLPAETTGVLYAPKHAIAFPAAARTTVPAGEELWLIVLSKAVPVVIVPIAALEAGIERVVDARSVSDAPAVLGWLYVSDADRAAVKTARGVQLPRIGISAGGKEIVAASLPGHDALNGAFVLFRGLSAGEADLRLDGRGWLPFRRSFRIAPKPVTLLYEPIVAGASATVMVNWSTSSDLPALDRSLGSCEPQKEAPRFELTISACPKPTPGKTPGPCTAIHKETLRSELKFGSVRVEEVPPGMYQAELRFGRLPPVEVTADVAPLQQQPMPSLQAMYFEAYGSLTRGGAPLGEEARIAFPSAGVGFSPREGDYRGVVKEGFLEEAKIDIVTCSGRRAFVLAEQGMEVWSRARFDIDIPDNTLTISVVDTFTQMPLPAAALTYVVMSKRVPRRPVFIRDVSQSGEGDEPGNRDAGKFVIKEVPPGRELRLTVTCPGYKKKEIDPFSMTGSEKKVIDVDLVPLGGSEAKVLSARPFANGAIFWYSSAGVETERADLAPDGTFHFEQTHYRDETMTIVSLSHPLWILRAPPVERATPLQVRFPDAAPGRDAEVVINNISARMVTPVGVAIGGLRIPQPVLAQHLALRGVAPLVMGGGPLLIPALAESGPIDILRGPSSFQQQVQARQRLQQQPPLLETLMIRTFAPVATQRLEPGSAGVTFDSVSK
jgi:hypothetical protein